MKNTICKIFTALILAVCSHNIYAATQIENINGSWLGTMNIPEGPSLRIGVEVFKKADGSWGGNIASLDQGARYMLVDEVSVENDIFTLKMAGAPVSIVGKVSDNYLVITSKFKQGDSQFNLELKKVRVLPEIMRSQTPKHSANYIQQEVKYKNDHDNTWLSGTMTLPDDSKQYPAIMLVAGSGPNHRDSYHAGHRTFKVLADHLTKQGFAVLRSDKRGVYKSSGNFEEATINDLVRDTQASIRYLKSHKNVDPTNIILIGHSEGSLVSIMAAGHEKVHGLVSLAGPGMSILDILLLQDQTEPAAKGATHSETAILLQFSERFYNIILKTPSAELRKQNIIDLYDNLKGIEATTINKWVNKHNGTLSISSAQSDSFYHFLKQSPLPHWNKFKGKALILNGTKDSQVPANENVTGIVNAIIAKEASVQSEIFEGLNHLFQPANTGSIDEYREIEQTIDEKVLTRVATWLSKNFS